MAVSALWVSTGWALIGGLLAWIVGLPTACHSASRGSSAARRHALVCVLVTSTLFGLIAWQSSVQVDTLAVSCLVLVGVRLAVIDLTSKLLPRALVLPLYPAILVLLGLGALVDGRPANLVRALVGMIVLPAAYMALALLSHGGIGAGDVRLAGPIGLVLAWHNWTTVMTGTTLAFIYTAATTLPLIVVGRADQHTGIPFGPGMLSGAFTAVLLQIG